MHEAIHEAMHEAMHESMYDSLHYLSTALFCLVPVILSLAFMLWFLWNLIRQSLKRQRRSR
jgi:hypothetical protein